MMTYFKQFENSNIDISRFSYIDEKDRSGEEQRLWLKKNILRQEEMKQGYINVRALLSRLKKFGLTVSRYSKVRKVDDADCQGELFTIIPIDAV